MGVERFPLEKTMRRAEIGPPATVLTLPTSHCRDIHDWREDYYGWRCARCPAFVPFGCEPWMPT